MRWLVVVLMLCGCPRSAAPGDEGDAGRALVAIIDAGPPVTLARLDAWLGWQKVMASLPPLGLDGGSSLRRRARQEAALLADAGLSFDQVDAIEAVVAAVVAERNVARLTGVEALQQFRQGVQQLGTEQRLKAEAAMADLQARSTQGSLAPLEAQYGADAVAVVLSREAEVTRTWDALLEARGDRR